MLSTIQNQLILYGSSISAILGNIGNLFIVLIFLRQRQNPCTIYIMSAAIVNSLYVTYYLLISVFPMNYRDGTLSELAACKLIIYTSNVLGQLPRTMIILACVDRFMITHNRATFRAFSTPKRAKWIVFFSVIFCLLFTIHIPIMTTISNGQCGRFGIYLTIYYAYMILVVGIIPPVLMGIFGYLTYRNMRQMHVRVQPIVRNRIDTNHSIRRLDRDLLIIVISEVLVYVITTTLFPLILLEMLISQYVISNKSAQHLQIEIFIVNIALVLLTLNDSIPFYIYLISSKSFRRDFKQLITNVCRKLRRQTAIMPVPRTNLDVTQRDTRV
jgi:hypothetical protein